MLPALVAGLLVGGLLVVGGYVVADGGGASATSTTTSAPGTATPTTVPAAGVAGFPPGYAAVDELVAIRPERVARQGDELLVTFTVATRRDFDPATTGGFQGADLELVLDPPIQATRLVFDPFVGGVFTAVFPYAGEVTDATEIRITARWERSIAFPEQLVQPASFPLDLEVGEVLELDEANGLAVDHVTLGEDGGELAWSISGEAEGAIVTATVAITEGFNDVSEIFMSDRESHPGFSTFIPTSPEHAQSGTVVLTPPSAVPEEVFEVFVFWNVAWVNTSPADATVRLGDAAAG
jgi:hypothetical protein